MNVANELYDLIKVCALPENQNDGWAKLSRKHGNEAKQNFRKLLRRKSIELNGDSIKIGKCITINVN